MQVDFGSNRYFLTGLKIDTQIYASTNLQTLTRDIIFIRLVYLFAKIYLFSQINSMACCLLDYNLLVMRYSGAFIDILIFIYY